MRTVSITTARPAHSCDIVIKPGIFGVWLSLAAERTGAERFIVLADRNVAALKSLAPKPAAIPAWDLVPVEPGEARKNLRQYAELCEQVLSLGPDRKTVLAAVGGGVTGDIAGFVAATLLRGIRFVQIPTTLLAQVDSSVGGKTGINAASGKNLVGAFHQPELVIVDPAFLDTLPEREYLAGLAEVVKYGMLADSAFFDLVRGNAGLLATRNHGLLSDAIERCCRIKAAIVADDETEKGRRALLNLGHTFGHAIESLAGYDGSVVHGEAVAAGMALAAGFAEQAGLLSAAEREAICSCLEELGLPTRIGSLGQSPGVKRLRWAEIATRAKLAAALLQDKKADNRALTLILPEAIGKCSIVKEVAVDKVVDYMLADIEKS